MKYIFGPINSRRFGISLGIDLSPDIKQCNFDCLYCELGSSKVIDKYNLVVNVDKIINEIKQIDLKFVDVLTITANGEPTLYPYLDKLVDRLKEFNKKILILTNGSTIYKKDIQNILKKIDIVKISLDCISKECFKKLDRSNIDINKIIQGLFEFKKDFKNSLVIEVLFVKGLNDKKSEVDKLSKVINKLSPDIVHLHTIDRPPAYKIDKVDISFLEEISSKFKNSQIPKRINKKLSYVDILNTIKKRPLSINELNKGDLEKIKDKVNIIDINNEKFIVFK